MQRISIVDSHTGGEPTRIVVAGGPDLGRGPLTERRERFQRDFDRYRSAVVNEPRGSDVVVGALLVEPEDKSCACGVILAWWSHSRTSAKSNLASTELKHLLASSPQRCIRTAKFLSPTFLAGARKKISLLMCPASAR